MTPGRPPARRPAPGPAPTADQATEDAMSNATTVSPAHSASTASTLITNIAALVTNDPSLGDGSPLGLIQDAAVVIEGDRVVWTGDQSKAPATDNRVDAGGRAVLPGFVDSHSHLVFAGDRTQAASVRRSPRPAPPRTPNWRRVSPATSPRPSVRARPPSRPSPATA
jgi:imidazolonepropionase